MNRQQRGCRMETVPHRTKGPVKETTSSMIPTCLALRWGISHQAHSKTTFGYVKWKILTWRYLDSSSLPSPDSKMVSILHTNMDDIRICGKMYYFHILEDYRFDILSYCFIAHLCSFFLKIPRNKLSKSSLCSHSPIHSCQGMDGRLPKHFEDSAPGTSCKVLGVLPSQTDNSAAGEGTSPSFSDAVVQATFIQTVQRQTGVLGTQVQITFNRCFRTGNHPCILYHRCNGPGKTLLPQGGGLSCKGVWLIASKRQLWFATAMQYWLVCLPKTLHHVEVAVWNWWHIFWPRLWHMWIGEMCFYIWKLITVPKNWSTRPAWGSWPPW